MTDPIGYTALQVIPTVAGVGPGIEGQIAGPLVAAGRSAGVDAGRAIAGGIAAARADVERASAALAAAQDKVADAAGKVRVAEAALQDLRDRGITSGPRLVRAEEALETARRRSVTATGNAERAADQLTEAQRRLANATDDVEESASGFGDTLSNFTDRAGPAVTQMLALGAAAAGLGGAMELATAAMDNEKLNDKLAAQLGAGPAMAEEFGGIAGRLYADAYGESLADVNDALRNVWQQGLLPEDASTAEIETLTGSVMDLATAFDQDAHGAAAALGTMLKNDLAPDAQTAMDILTRGFQSGADKGEDLLDTFIEYPAAFQALGLGADAAMGILSQGLGAGAFNADKVADALKEFQIRATDGSESSAAAFEALGLNAEEMTAQISAGGSGASAGLDLVLDRLRAMEDPVARNAAAVGIFGTQAEDLAGALFAIDPSEAVAALGDVEGAADRMATTLNDNAATRIEMFKRSLMGGFTEAAGTAVMWIERNRDAVQYLGIGLGVLVGAYASARIAAAGFAVAQGIQAAATGAGTAALAGNALATGAYTIAQGVIRGATLAWTGVQWALNAALTANPIGLVVLGIAALVAAVVLAWQNSETFRNVVMAAWSGIQTAAGAAWSFLQPIFSGIATWVTGTLVPAVLGFWHNGVEPAFSAIGSIVSLWWTGIAQPMFHNLGVVIGGVGAVVLWLWNSAFQPAFDGAGAVVSFWWNSVVSPAFGLAKAGIQEVGDIAMWLWTNGFQPTFGFIGDIVSGTWNNAISPAFEGIKSGVGAVGDAFSTAGKVIGSVWDAIPGVLRPAVHKVGEALAGVPTTFGPFEIPGAEAVSSLGRRLQAFAGGGMFRGVGSGTSDSNLALLSDREYVVNAVMTGKALPLLEAINGGWVPPAWLLDLLVNGGIPGFAAGGLVATQAWMRTQAGKPYQYGGVGDPNWDCSGAAGGGWAVWRGLNPNKRYFNTETDFESLGFLTGPGGPGDFTIGVMRGGGGPNSHMAWRAGELAGESNGSEGFVIGPDAADPSTFPLQWHYPGGGDDPTQALTGNAGGAGSVTPGLSGLGGGSGGSGGAGGGSGGAGVGGVGSDPGGNAVPVWVRGGTLSGLGTSASTSTGTAPVGGTTTAPDAGAAPPVGGSGVGEQYGAGAGTGGETDDPFAAQAKKTGDDVRGFFQNNWKEMLNSALAVAGMGAMGGGGGITINGIADGRGAATAVERVLRRKTFTVARKGAFGGGF